MWLTQVMPNAAMKSSLSAAAHSCPPLSTALKSCLPPSLAPKSSLRSAGKFRPLSTTDSSPPATAHSSPAHIPVPAPRKHLLEPPPVPAPRKRTPMMVLAADQSQVMSSEVFLCPQEQIFSVSWGPSEAGRLSCHGHGGHSQVSYFSGCLNRSCS